MQRPPAAAQIDAVVLKPLAREALTYAELVHEIDGVLLEQPCAHSVLDVLPRPILQHDRLNSGPGQQQRERQSCRPGAHDADLGAHH
jgi:hypothetical protein